MKRETLLQLLPVLFLAGSLPAAGLSIHHGAPDGLEARLSGKDAMLQLLATATGENGRESDVTREVVWQVEPEGMLAISKEGTAVPLQDGQARITASLADGSRAETAIRISGASANRPLHFANNIVPVMTKYGCNGGGCHGKSEGQNGFRLSLLGFEPSEDYGYLVHESRGRRLFPAAPENSLLLLKGTGEMPHGGGARLVRGSPDYQTLVRWMEQGMPKGDPSAPVPVRLAVYPPARLLAPDSEQQLQVTAHYSDGTWQDVTALVQYDSGAREMATVTASGLVRTASLPGDAAVMVRYMELAGVFRATIPLGAPLAEFPEEQNFIDQHVFAKLKTLGLPPSELCTDEVFVRRAAIDIAGRLPTPEEVQVFLADDSPGKRAAWVDRLLASGDYADYFASKWSALLRNKRGARPAYGTHAFFAWIRDSIYRNQPFSEFAASLVSASGSISTNPAVAWFHAVPTPQEQLQDIAQVFCGQRLQCAQCHHHPYEKWSQDDYYGFAAFFSNVGRKASDQPGEQAVFTQWKEASMPNPRTGAPQKPRPLGGESLSLTPGEDPREALAAWMTSPENPFFARMFVNRYWKHFFSRALVEPEDDLRVTNPAVNPELLDALADSFVRSGFDMKQFVRTICGSTTYQLSSLPNGHNVPDRQNFSRFYPRRLQAEVLLDAIDSVTGLPTRFPGQPVERRAVALPDNSFNSSNYFLTVFGRPDNTSACECERSQDSSLAQSLHLLNSKGIQEKLTAPDGRPARLAALEKPVEERLHDLFLSVYARPPEASETAAAMEYLARKSAGPEAWEDLVWALLNTKEFLFNH